MLNLPRSLAAAPDGTLYVADSSNHRILHLSTEGDVLHSWGSFGAIQNQSPPPGGSFNEPWGIAVGPEGNIFVADTWNHRIQKFSPEGEFLTSWGYFGQRETPEAFWGPRDIVIDSSGNLYVTDTGNKRIVVFDSDGVFRAEFGDIGLGPGEFDEPVGLAIDSNDNLYVADTWNQRVQVFQPDANGIAQNYAREWDIDGWYGESLDNKPFLEVSDTGQVYISDPEAARILVFSGEGEFLRYWGTFGMEDGNFNLPTGLTFDGQGNLWVADTGNNRLLRFSPPLEQQP
jgi:DNA-binding beta-propeller fold protein YncE